MFGAPQICAACCQPKGSAFTPLDLKPFLYLDATKIQGISDGQPVPVWPDLSGNGFSPLNVSISAQPTYVASGPNGLPYVLFDGVDDSLAAAYSLNQPVTVFSVMRWVSTAGSTFFDGGSLNTMRLYGTSDQINLYAGNNFEFSLDTTTWNAYCLVYNSSSSSVQLGAGGVTLGDVGTNSPNGLILAAQGSGGDNGNIAMGEFILYNRLLSLTETSSVVNYLMPKWGLA